MDKIEKICKFVKELQRDFISIHPKDCSLELIKSYAGYTYLDKVLSFLDTLSEEPDKSLEEAAEEYARLDEDGVWKDGGKYKGFIAGAEWKESQILKDAIYYVVQDDLDSHGASYNIPFIRIGRVTLDPKGIGVGDKVRIIVLKEEE